MIIACPSCATRFDAGNATFPPAGRKVKCARCSHIWVEKGIAAAPESVEAVKPAVAPPPQVAPSPAEPAAQPARNEAPPEMIWAGTDLPPRRASRSATFGLALACVALVAAGLVLFRDTITRILPGTAPAYAALGFEINVVGIEFRGIDYKWSTEDGVKTLAVTGEITNVTSEDRSVPLIRVALRGPDAKELHAWTFDSGISTLKAGESHAFREVLAKPPADAAELEVRFADAKR